MMISKDELRTRFAGCAPPPTFAGKIAERLRRMDEYRDAKTIFMMPSPLLFQARINCLLDGKILVMPSPALKLGFFRVKPFSIAFPDLAYGTSLKGITLFGKKMLAKQLQNTTIDLALTGCTALNQQGQRLGEGTGFFDLSMALLADAGALSAETPVGCVAGQEQISADEFNSDPWDIGLDFVVVLDSETRFERVGVLPEVVWDALAKKKIRKVEPLWQLYCALHPSPEDDEDDSEEDADDREDEQIIKEPPSPWAKALAKKT